MSSKPDCLPEMAKPKNQLVKPKSQIIAQLIFPIPIGARNPKEHQAGAFDHEKFLPVCFWP